MFSTFSISHYHSIPNMYGHLWFAFFASGENYTEACEAPSAPYEGSNSTTRWRPRPQKPPSPPCRPWSVVWGLLVPNSRRSTKKLWKWDFMCSINRKSVCVVSVNDSIPVILFCLTENFNKKFILWKQCFCHFLSLTRVSWFCRWSAPETDWWILAELNILQNASLPARKYSLRSSFLALLCFLFVFIPADELSQNQPKNWTRSHMQKLWQNSTNLVSIGQTWLCSIKSTTFWFSSCILL